MKFGKRLGAEAGRGLQESFLDYKCCKRAIGKDVDAQDPEGKDFHAALHHELQKVSAFFLEKEEELQAVMQTVAQKDAAALISFRAEILALRKYSVLNSTAVIKLVKKRNRHLGTAVGGSLRPLHATEVLSHQHFFTSTKLAKLATQAEILSKELPSLDNAAKALEDYECPICLTILENPVVLSCAHRFCWGCLLSHCATSKEPEHGHGTSNGKEDAKQGLQHLTVMMGGRRQPATYACPVCREAHILDLDRLQVDSDLTTFINNLKQQLSRADMSKAQAAALPHTPNMSMMLALNTKAPPAETETLKPLTAKIENAALDEHQDAESAVYLEGQEMCNSCSAPPLLPPQSKSMEGRLTVVLDLDGTLISSFTPRRAPTFARGYNSYVVGRGAKLNPNGVLVVERPDLAHFFAALNLFAEVVVFTAGLEDYAAPICKALEARYGVFTATLFRPATVASSAYPCVKDLSMLGRDLKRTVLVDDTPLAFLRQPNNGIPIFSFRGDVDDRVLPEAILPLLEQLAGCSDVRPLLQRRFNMPQWLTSHGITTSPTKAIQNPGAAQRRLESAPFRAKTSNTEPLEVEEAISETLILSDFDKTLTDCDAGDRLIGELAPELAPMLASLQQPANFVPLTNAVLSEAARRGISRGQVESSLQKMGEEIPPASKQLLRWAAKNNIDVRLISDCNTFFISQMLAGAGASALVKSIITNPAKFEQTMASDSAQDLSTVDVCTRGKNLQQCSKQQECSQHLVIQPRHDQAGLGPHSCPICPTNLCKGLELSRLKEQAAYKRILYLGDGANDLCPAMRLTASDIVLARKEFDLDRLIQKRQLQNEHVRAKVVTWADHKELFELIQQLAL